MEPKELEQEIILNKDVEVAANTEIIFKGFVDDLAYIHIRKEADGQWHEYGFLTKAGERIGRKKSLGGETLDFSTNYVLLSIVHSTQKPTKLIRRSVVLNEAGEFVKTRMVEDGPFFKTSSKITYEDENGNTKELWLGDSEKIVSLGLTKNN